MRAGGAGHEGSALFACCWVWEWRARPGEPRCLELDGNSLEARGRSVADGLTCETLGSNSKTWSNNEDFFFNSNHVVGKVILLL